jgi:hypothetical protein
MNQFSWDSEYCIYNQWCTHFGFSAIKAAAEREKARAPTAELKAIREAGAKAEVTANMVDVTRVVAFIV